MTKRSEGVRRIVLIISVLSVIGWISWVAIKSDGFSGVQLVGWLIFTGGLVLAYFIPQLICRASYWVIDGFKKDKET